MKKEKFIPQRGEIAEFRVLPHDAPVEREFIDVTADGMYLSWNYGKTAAQRWFHATPIKELLFTNSLGEEFYEGDEIWYYGKNSYTIKCCSSTLDISFDESSSTSEVYKTEETANEMLRRYKIEQAWKNGGNLQVLLGETQLSDGYWSNVNSYKITQPSDPSWKPLWDKHDYRIKPKAEYVPFTIDDITDKLLCKVVKNKDAGKFRLLGSLSLDKVTLDWYFRKFTFLDGSPVGKLKTN